MAMSNSMTKLLNKMERRLGTKAINLPEGLRKDDWAEIVIEDSLSTFSRYFPHKIVYTVKKEHRSTKRPGYYHIDEDLIPGDIEIYGLRDIDFASIAQSSLYSTDGSGGLYTPLEYGGYSFEDIIMAQSAADMNSVINYGIFVEYEHPHFIALRNSTDNNVGAGISQFRVELFCKHPDNLNTISPTKMETFEKLVLLDIKIFLFNALKLYDNIETVFGNIELRIDDWSSAEDDRTSLIEQLGDQYVSAGNQNQPMMFVI